MLEIDFGEEGRFPKNAPYSIYLPNYPVEPPDIRMTENENLRRIYLMAPGLTALTISAIDFIANGRSSEPGIGMFFLGALATIVGYGVGTQAALDDKARTIGAELQSLDNADEEFRQRYPEDYKLLYPVSSLQKDKDRDQA